MLPRFLKITDYETLILFSFRCWRLTLRLLLKLELPKHLEPVTEPPKIIPYYRLSWSTWPLSNNKELLSRFRQVKPGKSHTTGSLICAKPTRRRDQSTTLHYIKGSQVLKYLILQTRFFVHESKHDQSLNSGNKTSAWYTREAIHVYHSSSSFSHSSSQPSGIEPGQMGLPENHKLSKAEY
jgi:hypothetical protein